MRKANKDTDKKSATYVSMTYAESITPPTVIDYKETRHILNDFCIFVTVADIPRFPRMVDLIHWRTGVINNHLESFPA